MSVRIQEGQSERIWANVVDDSGNPLTGLSNVYIYIQRKSDKYWFDFDDNTFKNSAWTSVYYVMSENDATNNPGGYYYDFDTSAITNLVNDDTYYIVITCSSASNSPLYGEIKVGDFVDNIDSQISNLPTLSEIEGSSVLAKEATLSLVESKTSNLPSDPASESNVDENEVKIDNVESLLTNVNYGLAALKTLIDVVQADLDNPDQYKADVSNLALESTLNAIKGAGWSIETLKNIYDAIDVLENISTTDVENAVWDADTSSHNNAGTFGEKNQKSVPSENIDDYKADLTSISDAIARLLGLSHENVYHHTRVYSGNNLTSCKIDIYDSKANAESHDGVTGIVAKYTATFTYSGDNLSTMTVVRDS